MADTDPPGSTTEDRPPTQDAEIEVTLDGAAPDLPTVDPVHYVIVAEHGRGGLGRVLRALDRRLGRPVALKELLKEGDAGSRLRFVREAVITARLEHPAIVPVHEAGRWPDGRLFYAMKMVKGRALSDVIRATETLDERLALLPVAIAVAEAIGYAHSQRIIHRDLKPANILVGAFGETVVIDWGLAKDLRSETSKEEEAVAALDTSSADLDPASGRTIDGTVVGTPAYMPPEQAAARPVDERADVYAIGAILYSLLTGHAPYEASNAIGLLFQVVAGPPEALDKAQPGVPRELAHIVEKAMARRPEDRYPTGKELAEDLKRFQTGQLVAAHHYSRGELVRRWLRRYRLPVLVSATALALLAGLGTVSVRRIVAERDRADHERRVAEEARGREAARVDELTLSQARGALDDDPTASLAWIKRLREGSAVIDSAAAVADTALLRGVATRLVEGHEEAIVDAAFSRDGKRLATAARDRTLRDVAIEDRRPPIVCRLPFLPTRIAALVEGGWLVAGDDGGLGICAAADGALRRLAGHPGRIVDLAVAPDGRLAATCGVDGTARLWRLPDGTLTRTLALAGAGARLAFSPDGHHLATRDAEGPRLWSLGDGSFVALRGEGFGGAGGLAFSPDGKAIFAGGRERVGRWDSPGGAPRPALDGGGHTLAISPDGSLLAGGDAEGEVGLWRLEDGSRAELSHHGDLARDLAFSPDGARLVSSRGAAVRLWDVGSREMRKLKGHELDVGRVIFSPDGKSLLTVGLDHDGRLWSLAAGQARWLTVERGGPRALSSDGRIAATGGLGDGGREIALADLEGGARRRLSGHAGAVRRVAFTTDGKALASAGEDGLRLWDVATGQGRAAEGHAGAVTDVAPAPWGVVSGGSDGTVRRWSVAGEGRLLRRHGEPVRRVAASADGHLVASADGREILVGDGEPSRRITIPGPLSHLAFTPDGRIVAVVEGDHRLRWWDPSTGAARERAEDEPIVGLGFLGGGWAALGQGGGVVVVRQLGGDEGWTLVDPAKSHRDRKHVLADLLVSADRGTLLLVEDDGRARLFRGLFPAQPEARRRWLAATTDAIIGEGDRLSAAR